MYLKRLRLIKMLDGYVPMADRDIRALPEGLGQVFLGLSDVLDE